MKWVVSIIVMLFVAVPVHFVTVVGAPNLIMSAAMDAIMAQARNEPESRSWYRSLWDWAARSREESGANTMVYTPRPTAAARGIVKPSPDLLYAICVYDVSVNPLKISAMVPTTTYWSVALYSDETDNFFVMNDAKAFEQFPSRELKLFLVSDQDEEIAAPPGYTRVFAPTDRGIVLFRLLVNDEAKLAELDAIRHRANCEMLQVERELF